MNLETFLTCLMIVSVMTSLCTEAVKTVLDTTGINYHSNLLAGFEALALSIVVGISYMILTGTALTSELCVYLIALVLMSWLSAMVGYDKVLQAISQFTK